MRGQHGPDLEPRRRRPQLVVAHACLPELPDGRRKRLARHPSLVLVLPPPSQPVVLLRDVRELEEEREGAQHGRLTVELESADRALELAAVARLARGARQSADALLQREQVLALLLDDHLPEHLAEQADVRPELRLGRHPLHSTSAGAVA